MSIEKLIERKSDRDGGTSRKKETPSSVDFFFRSQKLEGHASVSHLQAIPTKPIAQMVVDENSMGDNECEKKKRRRGVTEWQEREKDWKGRKFQRRHWFYVIPAIRRLPFPVWTTGARNSNTTQERTSS